MDKISKLKDEELYFLILHFLKNGPLKIISDQLEKELIRLDLLPKSRNIDGSSNKLTYEELILRYSHIPPNYLKWALLQLLEEKSPFPCDEYTLLGQNDYSLVTQKEYEEYKRNSSILALNKQKSRVLTNSENFLMEYSVPSNISSSRKFNSYSHQINHKFKAPNFMFTQIQREIGLKMRSEYTFPLFSYKSIDILKKIRGHVSESYCIIFDRSSQLIITGSDDRLIKVWSIKTGLLISTLKGHNGDITALSIDYKNSILASSSNDFSIRLWSLKTLSPIGVFLSTHSEPVTEMFFTPDIENPTLISTALDGNIIIWKINFENEDFDGFSYTKEVLTSPCEIICASLSPGGTRLATGHVDGNVLIWSISPPKLIQKLQGHRNVVNSISWSHTGGKLLTGSHDGSVRVWKFSENEGWTCEHCLSLSEGTRSSPKISTAIWSLKDDYIIVTTSKSQNVPRLRIYDSNTGEVLHKLSHHTKEVYVIDNHPFDPRVFVTAGYDGKVIFWNIKKGEPLAIFTADEELDVSYFDGKFSPDGNIFSSIDKHGTFWIFGPKSFGNFANTPEEQFFTNDYSQIYMDSSGYILDAETNLPPHMVPRQSLCNFYMHPYMEQPIPIDPRTLDRFTERDILHQSALRKKITDEELCTICKYEPKEMEQEMEEEHVDIETEQIDENISNNESILDENLEDERSYHMDDSHEDEEFVIENSEASELDDEYEENEYFLSDNEISDDEGITLRRNRTVRRDPNVYTDLSDELIFYDEDEDEEVEDEDEEERLLMTPRKKRKLNKSTESQSITTRRKQKIKEYPFWVQLVKSTIAYIPQIDDEVIFFKKGYHLYLKNLKFSLKNNLPEFVPNVALCKIVDITYHNVPYIHFMIHLKVITNDSNINIENTSINNLPEDENIDNDIFHDDDQEFEMNDDEDDMYEEDSASDFEDESENSFTEGIYKLRISKRNNYGERPTRRRAKKSKQDNKEDDMHYIKDGVVHFTVPFHSCAAESPDFLILKSRYDQSLNVNWYIDKKIASWMYYPGKEGQNGGGEWFYGYVKNVPKFESYLDENIWESIRILWIGDEEEESNASPWEVEELDENSEIIPGYIEAIDPQVSQELIQKFQEIAEQSVHAIPFKEPVSLELYPDYISFVPYPIDIGTICKRLSSNYYRSIKQLEKEINLIYENALLFNEPESDIVNSADEIRRLFLSEVSRYQNCEIINIRRNI